MAQCTSVAVRRPVPTLAWPSCLWCQSPIQPGTGIFVGGHHWHPDCLGHLVGWAESVQRTADGWPLIKGMRVWTDFDAEWEVIDVGYTIVELVHVDKHWQVVFTFDQVWACWPGQEGRVA